MRKYVFILVVCAAVFSFSVSIAQQKSISVLIRTSLNGANEGFPFLSKETLQDSGEWKYTISSEIVNQFAGVSGIYIKSVQDHKSVLMNDELYTINQMRINNDFLILPSDIPDKDDFLKSKFIKAVDFFKNEYGTLLNFTGVIRPAISSDSDNKPIYITYFYEKSIDIPDSLTDIIDIEKQLDILIWFSVELLQNNSNPDTYYLSFRINGAQKQ